jgi:hypothetical protein
MNETDTLSQRTLHEKISADQLLEERTRLLVEHRLTLETVFDTFQKESGRKDVVAARTEEGKCVILRLGERRPSWLFPKGFLGTHIRFPRIIASGGDQIPFEIEEAVVGTIMIELDHATESTGRLSDETLRKLANAFWEFQRITASFPLESMYSLANAEKFLAKLDSGLVPMLRATAEHHRDFFEDLYPSKWKFATDNLILDTDERVALIDNVKVGKRYFGYDIGWIIWPPWLHMSIDAYADVDEHLTYLDHVKKIFFSNVPGDVDHPADLDRAFNLIIFERLVGSLFDITNKTKHLASSGLDTVHIDRLEAHTQFLQSMLANILDRLK